MMRLRLNLRVDTDADPGPTEYVIDTPAFQPGTFELGLPLPAGRVGGAAWVTAEPLASSSGWGRIDPSCALRAPDRSAGAARTWPPAGPSHSSPLIA